MCIKKPIFPPWLTLNLYTVKRIVIYCDELYIVQNLKKKYNSWHTHTYRGSDMLNFTVKAAH